MWPLGLQMRRWPNPWIPVRGHQSPVCAWPALHDRCLARRWRYLVDVAIGPRGRVQALAGTFSQSWLNWRTPNDIMMESRWKH